MRVEATATTLSWIPSDIARGMIRAGMSMGLTHTDDPPPDRLAPGEVHALNADDRFRWGNLLEGWADVDGDRVTDAGYGDGSGLVIGITRVRVGPFTVALRAGRLPTIRQDPEVGGDGSVRLVQTVGGRTGAPFPRAVPHRPFAQWLSPVVWTTLGLTLRPDGSSTVELVGASPFPRHWVYGPDGRLAAKSGVTDQESWTRNAFGHRTPWGDEDSPAVVAEAGTDLERQLSDEIMGGATPEVRRLDTGDTLTRQGEPGDELFLVLDGMLAVEVDGEEVGQVGPGAVLGERSLLEGGRRTATLRAVTRVSVAVAPRDTIDLERLADLAAGHRREEG
ncbi:cyclic nucleotide-binding domain-containing protein [Phycicoccus sonneratiae]|uniref:Cyclic nucleotide-binding domain-containing protein n=1 Tax=Phycicoccus sonneratiae TaxID=2807628 RepID=A0ABS2CQM4_9MICO|nr:cyclic nucleotide-binding domain-containing protein [Phycicoccus sonneraticus]MBM6402135.1 cyclic nucleotide-binding domain-containing protein [Phycicoccus sonneraticus]